MPKERRDRSVSYDRFKASPFRCSSSSCSRRPLPKSSSESEENVKEWEEARCPVCIEHPHNAILLLCSSHEKGCRPYMCDTSYRHSNCFDQFRKSSVQAPLGEAAPTMPIEVGTPPPNTQTNQIPILEAAETGLQGERSEDMKVKTNLVCPLCRGKINGWMVVESARHFMNAKSRSCACESCDFCGPYGDLRKHARLVHPLVRPSEADPERERDWRRLERQRDLGDLISTLQSSMGDEGDDESALSFDEGGWLTVFFLIRVFRPSSSTRSSSWSGTSRARAQVTVRRRSTRLWGESYDGDTLSSSRDDDNESSDGGSGPRRHHGQARRRTTPDNGGR